MILFAVRKILLQHYGHVTIGFIIEGDGDHGFKNIIRDRILHLETSHPGNFTIKIVYEKRLWISEVNKKNLS